MGGEAHSRMWLCGCQSKSFFGNIEGVVWRGREEEERTASEQSDIWAFGISGGGGFESDGIGG